MLDGSVRRNEFDDACLKAHSMDSPGMAKTMCDKRT